MKPSDFRDFANNLRVLAKVFDGTANSIEEMKLESIEPTNVRSGRNGIKGLSSFAYGVAKALTETLYDLLPVIPEAEDAIADLKSKQAKKKPAPKKAPKHQ